MTDDEELVNRVPACLRTICAVTRADDSVLLYSVLYENVLTSSSIFINVKLKKSNFVLNRANLKKLVSSPDHRGGRHSVRPRLIIIIVLTTQINSRIQMHSAGYINKGDAETLAISLEGDLIALCAVYDSQHISHSNGRRIRFIISTPRDQSATRELQVPAAVERVLPIHIEGQTWRKADERFGRR